MGGMGGCMGGGGVEGGAGGAGGKGAQPADDPKLPPAPKAQELAWTAIFSPQLATRTVLLGYVFAAIEVGYYGSASPALDPSTSGLPSRLAVCCG
jgi:hypothetical protein